MSMSMWECALRKCENCGETRMEEILYCGGNGEPCFEECEFYRGNLNFITRFITRLFCKRIPRPDCEQAEYRDVCIECGCVRETVDSTFKH